MEWLWYMELVMVGVWFAQRGCFYRSWCHDNSSPGVLSDWPSASRDRTRTHMTPVHTHTFSLKTVREDVSQTFAPWDHHHEWHHHQGPVPDAESRGCEVLSHARAGSSPRSLCCH